MWSNEILETVIFILFFGSSFVFVFLQTLKILKYHKLESISTVFLFVFLQFSQLNTSNPDVCEYLAVKCFGLLLLSYLERIMNHESAAMDKISTWFSVTASFKHNFIF